VFDDGQVLFDAFVRLEGIEAPGRDLSAGIPG
jgi:hypothetical protein